ncbi:MAG: MerR family transcriptional regulator [Oscillospiraceae bacterium]
MERRYLTISEFAGLRNVSIGSLRYYEKLKILTPARIDPATNYRYYLPEQLKTLDTIMLCVALDIPLKDLKNYVDEEGALDEKSILETGKKAMQDKISEMQAKLEITQFGLDTIARNQRYSERKGVYIREIEERYLIEAPFPGEWKDLSLEEKEPIELFQEAQAKNMAPVFPPGIMIHCETEPVRLSLFFRVLHPDLQDTRIIHLPQAPYRCLQADLTSQTDIRKLLEENFPLQRRKTIIISNMLLSKLHFDSMHSEIQAAAETS